MAVVGVNTTITLNTFMVPNFATVAKKPGPRQDGIQDQQGIPIADLDAEALERLAFAWLEELYSKARKSNPFTIIKGGP